jgi:hypothetical protein
MAKRKSRKSDQSNAPATENPTVETATAENPTTPVGPTAVEVLQAVLDANSAFEVERLTDTQVRCLKPGTPLAELKTLLAEMSGRVRQFSPRRVVGEVINQRDGVADGFVFEVV